MTDTASSTIAVDRGVWEDAVLAAMVAPPVIVSSLPVQHPSEDAQRRAREVDQVSI